MSTDNDTVWAHKARALLLPTPLAEIDPEGEDERAKNVCEKLELPSGEDGFQKRCAEDARGVHLLSGLGKRAPIAVTDGNVSLPSLLHPMSGEALDRDRARVFPVEELRSEYGKWIESLPIATACQDSNGYARLWFKLQQSAREGDHKDWLSRIPGDSQLRDHSWFALRTMAAALVGARYGGGQACLLNLHCGPVQSFIGAARRTSDLWLGSYLVSLFSYQATRAIATRCGPDSIVYPDLSTLPLALRDRCAAEKGDRLKFNPSWLRASQPNRFVAIVDSGDAREIAEEAAQAVVERWRKMSERVRQGIASHVSGAGGFHRFEEQIAEQIEIDVVIQPWPDDVEEIRTLLVEAERKFKGSTPKNPGECYGDVFCLGRDTLGAQRRVLSLRQGTGDTRTKCTQCGLREAMGPMNGGRRGHERWWEGLRSGLRGYKGNERAKEQETVDFREGEALCAVCLTKRLGPRFDLAGESGELGLRWKDKGRKKGAGKKDRVHLRFPSVASIAAAPLRLLLLEHADHPDVEQWLKGLKLAYETLDFTEPGNTLPGLGKVGHSKALLNPDGTWLYDRSYDPDTAIRDYDHPDVEKGTLRNTIDTAHRSFARMIKLLGSKDAPVRATPYYAVLVLDVDRMGKWLDGSHDEGPWLHDEDKRRRPISSSLHVEVSRRQGKLATSTLHKVVEKEHLGRLVYSGGDDVLAIVPLHTLWECLRDIECAFKSNDALGSKVSLSAGVAICDWRSPLSLALRLARRAEAKAKEKRDCVVVQLEVRSGAPIELRLPWRMAVVDGGDEECVSDLGDLAEAVDELSSADRDEEHAPELLKPSAAETLHRELDTLRHAGLEMAFEQRVYDLVGKDGKARHWLRWMVEQRPQPRPDRIQPIGRVIDFLLLLRFLVREQGGISHELVRAKIKAHRDNTKELRS